MMLYSRVQQIFCIINLIFIIYGSTCIARKLKHGSGSDSGIVHKCEMNIQYPIVGELQLLLKDITSRNMQLFLDILSNYRKHVKCNSRFDVFKQPKKVSQRTWSTVLQNLRNRNINKHQLEATLQIARKIIKDILQEAYKNLLSMQVLQRKHTLESGKKHSYSAEVAFLTWNSELFQPRASLLKDSILSVFTSHTKILVLVFQENLPYKVEDMAGFVMTMVHILESSGYGKWKLLGETSMKNIMGTKVGTVNTQTVIALAKSDFAANEILDTKVCHYSHKSLGISREKGFVGITLRWNGVGDILFMGVHLPVREGNKFIKAYLSNAYALCTFDDKKKNKSPFDGGIFLSGDINTRYNVGTMELIASLSDAYSTLGEDSYWKSLYDFYLSIYPFGNADASMNFNAFFNDPTGGGELERSSSTSLSRVFLREGFTQVATCYDAGWTYKFVVGSCSCFQGLKRQCANALGTIKNCLADPITKAVQKLEETCKKSTDVNLQLGYLDKLFVKQPSSGAKVLITSGTKTVLQQSDHSLMSYQMKFFYTP